MKNKQRAFSLVLLLSALSIYSEQLQVKNVTDTAAQKAGDLATSAADAVGADGKRVGETVKTAVEKLEGPATSAAGAALDAINAKGKKVADVIKKTSGISSFAQKAGDLAITAADAVGVDGKKVGEAVKAVAEKLEGPATSAAVAVLDTINTKNEKVADVIKRTSAAASLGVAQLRLNNAHANAEAAWREEEAAHADKAELTEGIKIAKRELDRLKAELEQAKADFNKTCGEIYNHPEIVKKGQDEGFVDKIEEAVLAVENAVVDSASAVKDKVYSGAQSIKDLASSTAAHAKLKLEEARAEHAQKRAREAQEERDKIEKKFDELCGKIETAEEQLAETLKKAELARRVALIQHPNTLVK